MPIFGLTTLALKRTPCENWAMLIDEITRQYLVLYYIILYYNIVSSLPIHALPPLGPMKGPSMTRAKKVKCVS